MKDVKVYDGSGWQSLKGPPGPSEPSADAGNVLTKGSDGLLWSRGPIGGRWTPIHYYEDDSGASVSVEGEGFFVVTNTGGISVASVWATIDVPEPQGGIWYIEGMPFGGMAAWSGVYMPASAVDGASPLGAHTEDNGENVGVLSRGKAGARLGIFASFPITSPPDGWRVP